MKVTTVVMQAANTLRAHVPRLYATYIEKLPPEADGFFEKTYYENLQSDVNSLFDDLLGLCQRFDEDRKAEATGQPWRGNEKSKDELPEEEDQDET